jgi:hypothetical protein
LRNKQISRNVNFYAFKNFDLIHAVRQRGNECLSSSLHACDAWSFTVKDEHRSRIFGKRGLIGKE